MLTIQKNAYICPQTYNIMAEITKNKHSHSNLPGRVESPAIEIYASTGMPKDNVMPTYTHTQTFGHTISFTATTPGKLMELPPAELYKLPEESWSDYYREVKEVYSDIVETVHDELDLWCMKMKYVQKSPPTAIQYDKKIDLLCQSLDPIEIDGTFYVSTSQMVFPHGLSDKKDCGQYLIINGCTPEIVKLLSGIEYLMLKKAELLMQQPPVATEEKTMPVGEAKNTKKDMDEHTALLHWLMNYNYLNEKGKPHPKIYVLEAIRDLFRTHEISWAKNCSSFTRKLSDEKLNTKTAGALAKDMTRNLTCLKIDSSSDYIHLQALGLTDLEKQFSKHAAEGELKKLKTIYAQVQSHAEEFKRDKQRQNKDKIKTQRQAKTNHK